MGDNYEIINSQVIFIYERSIDIRKRQFEFEDSLKEYFKVPFSNFAISDDQDGNIPRFEGVSQHGFSKLQATQFRTNLITNFTDEYRTNIDLIKVYLADRITILKDLLQTEKNNFAAFIIELGFAYESEQEINDVLKSHTGANCINTSTNDFSLSYSTEYKDDYFINIKCSKYTEGRFKIVDGQLEPDGDTQKRGISIILDINSKLAHKKRKEYGVDILDSLESETFQILSTYTLEDYLNGNIK